MVENAHSFPPSHPLWYKSKISAMSVSQTFVSVKTIFEIALLVGDLKNDKLIFSGNFEKCGYPRDGERGGGWLFCDNKGEAVDFFISWILKLGKLQGFKYLKKQQIYYGVEKIYTSKTFRCFQRTTVRATKWSTNSDSFSNLAKRWKYRTEKSTLSRQRKATKISFTGSSLHEDHQVYVYVSKNFIIQDIK